MADAATWLGKAERFATAAERAKDQGDLVAFVALITVAAQCVQLAKLLESTDGR
jgi:hypothetical protein